MNSDDGRSSRAGASKNMKNVFFASTFGQIRNAVNITRSHEIDDVCFVILYTNSNTAVVDEMVSYADLLGLAFIKHELPLFPTSGLPWIIRRIQRDYLNLMDQIRPKNVWIASPNFHYAILADMAVARGCKVNYYEEGLGSYRSAVDFNYPTWPFRQRMVIFRNEMAAALRLYAKQSFLGRIILFLIRLCFQILNEFKSTGRFILIASNKILLFLLRSKARRRLLKPFLTEAQMRFFGYFSEFDSAIVAFPSLLDEEVFKGAQIKSYSWPTDPVLSAAIDESLVKLDLTDDTCLYISQNYGGNNPSYYKAVAFSLAEIGVKSVLYKAHPKEKNSNIELLNSALEMYGINYCRAPEVRGASAEDFMGTMRFKHVCGLTSSSILYGLNFFSDLEFYTLTPIILSSPNFATMKDDVKRRLAGDYDLFRDRLSKLGWQIENGIITRSHEGCHGAGHDEAPPLERDGHFL